MYLLFSVLSLFLKGVAVNLLLEIANQTYIGGVILENDFTIFRQKQTN